MSGRPRLNSGSMKSVVMIAYFFPPEGSAGTYRSLRFIRQLVKRRLVPAIDVGGTLQLRKVRSRTFGTHT